MLAATPAVAPLLVLVGGWILKFAPCLCCCFRAGSGWRQNRRDTDKILNRPRPPPTTQPDSHPDTSLRGRRERIVN